MPYFLALFLFLSSCSFKSSENKTDLFFKPQVYDYLLSCGSQKISFVDSFSNIFMDQKSQVYLYGFNSCLLKLSFKADLKGYIEPDSLQCHGKCQIPIQFYSSFFSCEKNLCSYSLGCKDISRVKMEQKKAEKDFFKIDFLIEKKYEKKHGLSYQSCQIKLKKIAF